MEEELVTEDELVSLFSNDALVLDAYFENHSDAAVIFDVFVADRILLVVLLLIVFDRSKLACVLCVLVLQIRAEARPLDEVTRQQQESEREKERIRNGDKSTIAGVAGSREDAQFAQQFEWLDTEKEMRKVTAAHSTRGKSKTAESE